MVSVNNKNSIIIIVLVIGLLFFLINNPDLGFFGSVLAIGDTCQSNADCGTADCRYTDNGAKCNLDARLCFNQISPELLVCASTAEEAMSFGGGVSSCPTNLWASGQCPASATCDFYSNNPDFDCEPFDIIDCIRVADECEGEKATECSDGTDVNTCSSVKPIYCQEFTSSTGTFAGLVNDCTKCGCSSGATCNSNTKECESGQENTCQSSGATCQSPSCLTGFKSNNLEGCPTGNVCCSVCSPRASFSCFGNDVRWFDECGNKGDVKEFCNKANFCDGDILNFNNQCSNNECGKFELLKVNLKRVHNQHLLCIHYFPYICDFLIQFWLYL